MEMNGRGFSGSYRFGYQGSEKDNEVSGDGNSYTTEFRQLDPRLGRWFSVDPIESSYPYITPYASMHNNPINLTDVRGLGPDGDGVAVATTNDGLAKADPAGNPVVFNPAEVKEIALVTTSGTFTLKDGTTTYVAEGSVLGYWDKDDKFHSATYQKNSDGDNYFVGYGSEKGTSGVKSSPSGAYFVGGVPENFKGESTKVACGNVERESAMGDDFKGDPIQVPGLNEAEVLGDIGDAFGGGANNILLDRASYWSNKTDIFKSNKEITVKLPQGRFDIKAKNLNKVRVVGKTLMVVGVVTTVLDAGIDMYNGKSKSSAAKIAVMTTALSVAAFVPGVGWGIALGIGIADYIWGDQFYDWVETGDWKSSEELEAQQNN